MKIFLISLALILASCAAIEEHGYPLETELDGELTQYFKYYTTVSGDDEIDSRNVKFALPNQLEEDQNGVCRTHIGGGPTWKEILINLDRWKDLTELQRTALMLHEFSHCEGGQEHHPNMFHIMYEFLQHEPWLSIHWTEVMEYTYGSSEILADLPADDMQTVYH